MTCDIPASVRGRLENLARQSGRPLQELMQYFVIERFLFRLSQSEYADRYWLWRCDRVAITPMGTGKKAHTLMTSASFRRIPLFERQSCRFLRHCALSPVTRSLPLVRYRNNLDPGFGNAKHDEVWKALH